MGFLDRLLGREEPRPNGSQQQNAAYQPYGGDGAAGQPAGATTPGVPGQAGAPQRSEDEIAVERYRYLLRTAPPETIEQVHEEAFAKLTPEQRRMVFEQLSQNAPAGEQPRADDPRSLAQAATRSELRQPGTLERSLGGYGAGAGAGGGRGGFGGPGLGSMFATSLLGSVAGYVIGSAIVSSFLPSPADNQADAGSGDQNTDNANDQNKDGSGDQGGDGGSGDQGGDGGSGDGGSTEAAGWDGGSGGDAGGGWDGGSGADAGGWGGGDWGGFGGGDFGGGDFGGGDFI